MTKFEEIKSKNIDEFAEWLDKHGVYDYSLWGNWFDENYCSKCEPILVSKGGTDYHFDIQCAWCELNGKCQFFKELDGTPDNKYVIKLWLETED